MIRSLSNPMSSSATSRRRESQGGYALLMVFLMAAIIALMLYQQLPRVAFESEREKEQLLIDRGEQYTRAIQLFYLANNRRWPTSIDDLEKREKRFLRRRYVDPYTGKDEWRIIHTTGGFLTDSLVQKAPLAGDDKSQSATNTPANTSTDAQPQINAAVLQRPSDRSFITPYSEPGPVVPAGSSTENMGATLPPLAIQTPPTALPPITLQPGGVNQPGGLPPITLMPTPSGQQIGGQNVGQAPGQLRPPQLFPGQPPVPPLPGQPGPGGLPGGIQTGMPPGFRIDANGQLVPITPAPDQSFGQTIGTPGTPGQLQGIPGQPVPPQLINQPTNQAGGAQGSPNTALNLINQLLTNPRQTTSTPAQSSGNQVGAIAGIASTHKGPSIKVYKDQSQYELWEFVFAPTALAGGAVGGPGGLPGGLPVGAPGGRGGPNQPGGQPGTFGPSQSGFGSEGGRGGPGQPGGIFAPIGR
jgi:hypothetical protein